MDKPGRTMFPSQSETLSVAPFHPSPKESTRCTSQSLPAQPALHGTSENIPTQRVDSRSRRACDCLIRDGRPLASVLALSSALRARSIMPAIQHHKVEALLQQ